MNAIAENLADPKLEALKLLRQPFPDHQISKLPKPYKKDSEKGNCRECGGYHGLPAAHLDYVGHAALTDRLLDADPSWTWEPLALDDKGLPLLDASGGMWIKLTVAGVTRFGYGDAQGKSGGDAMKERIGDALRNAAMRFGAALDLWHKGQLHLDEPDDDKGRDQEREIADMIAKFAADWAAKFEEITEPAKLESEWKACKASCMKFGDGTQALNAVKPAYAKRYRALVPQEQKS